MSEFTKGKWEIYDNPRHFGSDIVVGSRGHFLASVYSNPEAPEERDPNARLIAAAPEMYEWLKIIYETFAEGNVINVKPIKELLGRIDGEEEEANHD